MIVSVRLISVIGLAARHILNGKIEIKFCHYLKFSKFSQGLNRLRSLPVIILVVALLVIVLRLVVALLVIGLLK